MFIGRKQYEKLLQSLEDKLEKKFQAVSRSLGEGGGKLEGMNQDIGQLRTEVQKHNMAVEDLLDEWEDRRSEKDSTRKQMLEYEQSEKNLLELFESYQEQFWNLKRFADQKEEAWSVQIALMEKKLEHCRRLCGISIIEESGGTVDYDLHEVIEVVDTAEQEKDKVVAGIINWGYLYKGRVRKKAQITAYHAVDLDGAE